MIVFSETGLLVGFFLPGDSLLFTVGVVAGDGVLNIGLVIVLLSLSAMIGDSTGYFLGRRTGQAIFSRPDSLLFKREHLIRTKAFYESTAAGPLYTRALFPSCGHSPLLWRASLRCLIFAFCHTVSAAD